MKLKMIKRNFKIKRNLVVKRNKPPIQYVQLTQKSAKVLKKKLYIKQGGICPVLRKKVNVRDTVLDHKHKLKAQRPGPLGRGLVRGAIHFQVNSFEGILLKKYKRYGLTDLISLPTLLKNLADYLENPPCEPKFIYPSEKPKSKIFGKRDYDKIVKYYFELFPRRKKLPVYPESGIKKIGKLKKDGTQKYKYVAKLTSKWKKLLDAANLIHNKKGKK